MPTPVTPPNPMAMIVSTLAGAGWNKFTDGLNKLAQSGQDVNSIMSLPNFPLLLAGAGLKDAANSMELVAPIMKMFQPPQPPKQPDPAKTSAAMQMLSARMGGGLQGIQAPMPRPMGM